MINYKLIDESCDYYKDNGYTRIETPWMVPEYVESITRPKDKIPFQIKQNNKCLIGSGEQSFLYLYLKEYLPLGKFQTITPCFRNDEYDNLHSKYFIKNELIITDVVNKSALSQIIDLSLDFFNKYLPDQKDSQRPYASKISDDEYDIIYKGIELGSYGIRESKFLKWIYGTGCAEPRLSKAIEEYYNGIPQIKN